MKSKLSRAEESKKLRTILNSHGVNHSELLYGCFNRTITLEGSFQHYDNSSLKKHEIDLLLRNIYESFPGYTITCNLSSNESGEVDSVNTESDEVTYIINLDEEESFD